MITQKDISTFIKNVSRRSRGIPDKRLMHPSRDWMMGVLLVFPLFAAGVAFNVWLFLFYSNLESHIETEPLKTVDYHQGTLLEVLKKYENRRLEVAPAATVPIEQTTDIVFDVATTSASSSIEIVADVSASSSTTDVSSSTVVAE